MPDDLTSLTFWKHSSQKAGPWCRVKVRGTVKGLNSGLPPVQLPSVFIHQGIHFSLYMHRMCCKVSHLPSPQNSIQIPTTWNPTEANDKPVYGGSGEDTTAAAISGYARVAGQGAGHFLLRLRGCSSRPSQRSITQHWIINKASEYSSNWRKLPRCRNSWLVKLSS